MPYMEEDPIPLIQSDLDLQDTVEAGAAQEGFYSEDFEFGADPSAGPTVISLAESESSAMPPAPIADMEEDFDEVETFEASSSAKKRGRASKSASGTPAKSATSISKTPRSAGRSVAATPRSAKSTSAPKSARASTGRKRKAEETLAERSEEAEDQDGEDKDGEEDNEAESTPAPKRSRATGRPSRTAGVAASARLTAKAAAAKKPTRGRPKSTAATEKKPKGKGGRPKKNVEANGASSDDEYEVEAIRDSRIDAETMQHWYEIKWKGYPESDNSWEPKSNLKHSLDLVKAFDSKKKKQEIEDAAAKAKETVSKRAKAPKPASKVVKPVKKAAPTQNAPGRRGRPARTMRGSKK